MVLISLTSLQIISDGAANMKKAFEPSSLEQFNEDDLVLYEFIQLASSTEDKPRRDDCDLPDDDSYDADVEVEDEDSSDLELFNEQPVVEEAAIESVLKDMCKVNYQSSRLSCMAHQLQLVIKDGFKDVNITELIEKCSKIISKGSAH